MERMMKTNRLPTFFIPHGAGPCFFMEWQLAGAWQRMETWLRGLVDHAGTRPEALIVISAHWEAPAFTVNAARRPDLLFDYHGFPDSTYQLTWPAAGSPDLAARIGKLFTDSGIAHAEYTARGLDHGVFVPLKLAFPDADVPVVQLSLRQGLDPAAHVAMGRALAPLRDEGVLIIGSGMSYHNMRRLRLGGGPVDPESVHFDDWLTQTVAMTGDRRSQGLAGWAAAPGGRASHPREEHLLPLHVVAGAAYDEPGERLLRDEVIGSVQSAFRFGTPADRVAG
jgi:aromatic ring-opening dioxygenase catalytic subunit (LigB family)